MHPRSLNLENITIDASVVGKNAIYIENYPNTLIRNVSISNIKSGQRGVSGIYEIYNIIDYFSKNTETSHFILMKDQNPEVDCGEMVFFVKSNTISIDLLLISKISCGNSTKPLGLSLNSIFKCNISNLYLNDINGKTESGIALKIVASNQILISELKIENVVNTLGSIVLFNESHEIIIDSAKISDLISYYNSPIVVNNSLRFFMSKFSISKISSHFNNGGCLYLSTGILGSSFIIQSGNISECIYNNAKGGTIYFDSIMAKYLTIFQMHDLLITNCYSDEGSAIFI